ncbi:hypothetical protein NLU13_6803 [Sarocladium strictum]|uniref:Uncharacterized protein n=1 Tax=Sarocladium strictum TaxID=5046 RepID=A0AA39GED2_SARSR|nr:hypothetical protein NLU13_6803 [Sarocladium strictum]
MASQNKHVKRSDVENDVLYVGQWSKEPAQGNGNSHTGHPLSATRDVFGAKNNHHSALNASQEVEDITMFIREEVLAPSTGLPFDERTTRPPAATGPTRIVSVPPLKVQKNSDQMEGFIKATGDNRTIAEVLVAKATLAIQAEPPASTYSDSGRQRPKRKPTTPPSPAQRDLRRLTTGYQEPGRVMRQEQNSSPERQQIPTIATNAAVGTSTPAWNNTRSSATSPTSKGTRVPRTAYPGPSIEAASSTGQSIARRHSRSLISRHSITTTMPSTAPSAMPRQPPVIKISALPEPETRGGFACPFEKMGVSTSSEHVLRCRGADNSGFSDMGRVREHIYRAHIRKPIASCPNPGCPGCPWRSCFKGKGDAEKKRLQNDCPHDQLEARAYVWKEDVEQSFAGAERLEHEARWEYVYRHLFGLIDTDPVPDPFFESELSRTTDIHHDFMGSLGSVRSFEVESRDARVMDKFTILLRTRLSLDSESVLVDTIRATLEQAQIAVPE